MEKSLLLQLYFGLVFTLGSSFVQADNHERPVDYNLRVAQAKKCKKLCRGMKVVEIYRHPRVRTDTSKLHGMYILNKNRRELYVEDDIDPIVQRQGAYVTGQQVEIDGTKLTVEVLTKGGRALLSDKKWYQLSSGQLVVYQIGVQPDLTVQTADMSETAN